MGNESSSKKSKSKQNLATELTDINYADECAEEEYIDKTNCCWLEFQAVKKRIYVDMQVRSYGKIIS